LALLHRFSRAGQMALIRCAIGWVTFRGLFCVLDVALTAPIGGPGDAVNSRFAATGSRFAVRGAFSRILTQSRLKALKINHLARFDFRGGASLGTASRAMFFTNNQQKNNIVVTTA
jgi:hypothetical protein